MTSQLTLASSTGIILRDYQAAAIEAGVASLKDPSDENGLIVAPTGSGKSVIIAGIVQQLDAPALVFQPSKEILVQNAEKLRAYGFKPSIFSASMGSKRVGQITLATIGSAVGRPERFKHVKYILIDEAHAMLNPKNTDGMFSQFLARMPGVKLLGLTATPYRMQTDGFGGTILKFLTRTRPRVFHKVVYHIQNRELFDRGYLAKLVYETVPGFDKSKLKKNSTGADYTDESVKDHFREISFTERIVETVQMLCARGRKSILVFTRFVSEAEEISRSFPGQAAWVSAETHPDGRARCIHRFKSGQIRVMVNVQILGIGFDFPALDTVVLGNPTMSLARYYQWVGRAIRPHPSKDSALIVDMVDLVPQFGKVEDLTLVDGGHGKWHVESNGRQLTNVYYGDQPVGPETKPQVGLPPGFPALDWKQLGPGVKSAPATGLFWTRWRMNKDGLKAAGISVKRDKTEKWWVIWRQ